MLIKEIERVKIECDNSENLRIEAVEISDINMKALNQNLSNLRTEVKRQKDNLSQSEVVLNKIKGGSSMVYNQIFKHQILKHHINS